MKRNRVMLILSALLMLGLLLFGINSFSEEDHPVTLTVTVAPETQLVEGGEVEYLTFSIANRSDTEYTLTNARLSGGYDGNERALDGDITVLPGSSKEFTLDNVPVSDEQLGVEVVYTLRWDEVRLETPETESTRQDGSDPEAEPTVSPEPIRTVVSRTTTASVKIDRFVPPELTIKVTASTDYVDTGDTFTVTYHIANETQYDMTSLKLTDPGVSTEAIALPGTDLMAGASMTVPVEYTMGDEDMTFRPVASYIAAHRQTETVAEEPVTVGSVVIGIRLDVQQYPANEVGTTFAITVVNIGNRVMKQLQLYDEIYTPIDSPFDLGPQQQKVMTFSVPSAYASELVRTIRFRVSGLDFFGDNYTYVDVNSYEVVPYILSDAVRLTLFASVTNAFIDENGKLCGTVQIELRNYSDVRVLNAVLREETLFGTIQAYDELQRGETYYTTTFQLDNVPLLTFSATAQDSTGKGYATESVTISLDQLRSLATKTKDQTIIYYSNAFLRQLTDRIESSFRNAVSIVILLVLVCGVICLVLWILEHRINSRLPRESILSIRVPNVAKPAADGPIDRVLEGSPAEQLGYSAPIKIRYGTASVTKANHNERSVGSDSLSKIRLRGSSIPSEQQKRIAARPAKQNTASFQRPQPKQEPIKKTPVQTKPMTVPQSEIKRQPAANAHVVAHKAPHAKRSAVRIIEVQPAAQRRALRPNVIIRIGSGRET